MFFSPGQLCSRLPGSSSISWSLTAPSRKGPVGRLFPTPLRSPPASSHSSVLILNSQPAEEGRAGASERGHKALRGHIIC